MDDQRVGRVVRALRRRRGWRQLDLARAVGCSQGLISLIERGHVDRVSLHVLRSVLAALDARVVIDVHWRAGDLSRLIDEDHALLVAHIVAALHRHGWLAQTETTYSRYGERGSYDVIAFHAATGIVLVIEVKTDFPSVEASLRKIDEKVRLAPAVARERFGWSARSVSRLLVMSDDRTLRRRVDRHAVLLDAVFPARSNAVRRWLANPNGTMAGLWFVTATNARSGSRRPGGRSRVRIASASATQHPGC